MTDTVLQLVEAYRSTFVGKMFPERLLKILKGEHPLISVKDVRNGVIMFSDGQVLKCTGDYYERVDGAAVPKSANLFLKCRNVRKTFGIDSVSDISCSLCHIRCLQLEQSHELKRKVRQKGRRRKTS